MIDVANLTKRYGSTTAVDDLSFTVRPGIVTGFLGPNGAGKSTTTRMILGLDTPTSGRATVNGKPLSAHAAPLTQIGSLLEAKAIHPKRSARNHLRALAATTGISNRRVDEVLELVGLESVADRVAGGFSLGMGQRLGIASALLGDPETVMLDEPVNGLDPEGILWIRHLLKALAAEGRTVFVSSHLMSEMALTAEHFIIIGRGRLIKDVSGEELEAMASGQSVFVRTPDVGRLAATRIITADDDLAGVKIIILTTFELDDYVIEAVRAGASGFIGKGIEPVELLDAIRVVAAGDALLSPRATHALLAQFAADASANHQLPAATTAELDGLTTREREVMALAAFGLSNDEIAERLFLSPLTAKTHVNRAMMKLGARDRAQLVVIAYRTGLVRPGDTP